MKYEFLEITTQIGCPVNCLKHCPQEVTVGKYSGKRRLTIVDWEVVLSHIPQELPIYFSGLCEPFANPNTIDFIEMAHKAGHPVGIYTTLYQASREAVERLVKYQFLTFCLHLPDGEAMKIPLSQDYKDNVFTVIQNVKNVHFSIMNNLFVSMNRENITRGFSGKKKFFKLCVKLNHPQFNLLPNGNVSLCGNDFGLSHTLGNLYTEDYETVRKRFWSNRKKFELCSTCFYNNSPLKVVANYAHDKARTRLFHLPAEP
jgi:organic radical activating enzyme